MARKATSDASKRAVDRAASGGGLNPRWWMPTSLGLMLVGLLWVMTYYIASGTTSFPIPGIDAMNIVIGFVLIMAGFVMLTRWK